MNELEWMILKGAASLSAAILTMFLFLGVVAKIHAWRHRES